MTPFKLVDESGEILGSIIVPDTQLINFARDRRLVLRYVDSPSVSFKPDNLQAIDSHIHIIVIVPAHTRKDAVMLQGGSLWEFEKVEGCFFIPGYAFLMKGRR